VEEHFISLEMMNWLYRNLKEGLIRDPENGALKNAIQEIKKVEPVVESQSLLVGVLCWVVLILYILLIIRGRPTIPDEVFLMMMLSNNTFFPHY
jgi:hypothetical protein